MALARGMHDNTTIVFWNETAFALPYLVSLALALTLFVFGTQRGHIPVAGPLAVYALLQSVWIVGFLEESFATSLETKILWDDIQFIPFLFLPQIMLLTSRAFVGKPVLPLGWFHRGYLAVALFAMAVISLDPVLHWTRPDARLVEAFPRGELTYTFTPWMYLMVVASYSVTVVVLIRIWRHTEQGTGKSKKQGLLIFTGLMVPTVAGLLTVAGFTLGPHRDIAPLTFGLGDMIIVFGILRYRILDLVPIAIETAFQAMGDPIVIVDNEGTILAHNRAFATLRGVPGSTLVGRYSAPTIDPHSGDAPYDVVRIPMTAGTREEGVIWHYRDVRLLREAQAQQLERERLGALGRMATNLAHELNTPLASLLSASRFLQEKVPQFVDRLANDGLSRHLVEMASVPDNRPAKTRSADRRAWQDILESDGAAQARSWANRLTDAGILPRAPFPAPGWCQQPGWEASLEKACEVASLLTSLWVIQESADRGERIISAIQGLDQSLTEGPSERVSLEAVLTRALAALGSWEGTGTEVRLALQPEVMVLGTPPRLVQLCFQLLKNARQAAGAEGTILVRGFRRESTVVLEVEDSGPGIAEDHQQWIFSPFFTTRKAGEGSGLGLEIVKLVAKEHGAAWSFESQPGRTTFRVEFPAP